MESHLFSHPGQLSQAAHLRCWQRASLWLAALALSLPSPACDSVTERPGVPPRHLLLITVERARRDHVTALGYDRHTTGLLKLDQPYVLDIDYLGHAGVTFSSAFAPSSDDRVSLASLLTGALPLTGGSVDVDGALAAEPSTLAEDLARAGFSTGAFVNRNSLTDAECAQGGLGRGFGRAEFFSSDEALLAAAVGWLAQETAGPEGTEGEERPAGSEEPLLLWLHFGGIRLPFEGEPLSDRHSPVDYQGPVRPEAAFFEDLRAGRVELGRDDRARLRDLYDGRLLRITQLLNSFFFLYRNTIADGGLWEDTAIVLLGTSGCELAERGGRVATPDSLWGDGLHVPLQFWHPGSLTGERILDSVVGLTDVSATLRDWFGATARGAVDGQSLLALTDSYVERDFEQRGAFSLARQGPRITGASLRVERWRLVLEGAEPRLYDLRVDPGERHDVAADYPEVVEDLRLALDRRLRGPDS